MSTTDLILRMFTCMLVFVLCMIMIADVKYRVEANPELKAKWGNNQ